MRHFFFKAFIINVEIQAKKIKFQKAQIKTLRSNELNIK